MFAHLLGHDHIKVLLKKLLASKSFPNTLLFHGPKGVGKRLFALECAKALMGPSHVERIISGNHPDLHHLYPEGKSALHSAANVRSWIEEIGMPPFEAPCKVFLVHDAEQMQTVSSNTLLKTLEEPASDTYIFLLSDKPHEILPTILSRSYKVPFFPLSQEIITHYLLTKKHVPEEKTQQIAFRAAGSFEKVEEILSEKHQKMRALLYEVLRCELPRDYYHFMQYAEKLETLLAPEEEGEKHGGYLLLEEIFAWYRDLALLQCTSDHKIPFYHQEEIACLKGEVPKIHLEKIADKIEQAKLALARHMKLRVVLAELL